MPERRTVVSNASSRSTQCSTGTDQGARRRCPALATSPRSLARYPFNDRAVESTERSKWHDPSPAGRKETTDAICWPSGAKARCGSICPGPAKCISLRPRSHLMISNSLCGDHRLDRQLFRNGSCPNRFAAILQPKNHSLCPHSGASPCATGGSICRSTAGLKGAQPATHHQLQHL